MDKEPRLTPKHPDGTCTSCGRLLGCNCNASWEDWNERRHDKLDAAWQEEIDQLEYEQMEDESGSDSFWKDLGMTDFDGPWLYNAAESE